MQSNIYVSLSAQMALLKRLESVAHNVANLSTPGYRAERVSFEEMLTRQSSQSTSFVSEGRSFVATESGALEKTGNPLDIAVNGDAWLGLESPAGVIYTRDGRFTMSAEGELLSIKGFRLVDVGGNPIQIDANGPPPSIGRVGTVTQAGQVVATIGMFRMPEGTNLRRYENSAVVPDRPAEEELDFNRSSIAQGFIERSNTEPVHEMTRLITLQRTFEAISSAAGDVEEGLSNAIRTLGS